MRKIIVIGVREYGAAVKTKAFLITLIALPILWGGAIGIQVLLKDKVDTKDKKILIVDQTGMIYDAMDAAAVTWNGKDIYSGEGSDRRQVKPRFVVQEYEPLSDDRQQVELALSKKVREKEILAFVIIEPNVIDPSDNSELDSVRYYSNSPTYNDFFRWLREHIHARVQALRFKAAALDAEVVKRATRMPLFSNLGLVSLDDSGHVTKAEKSNRLANIFVPMGLMMLMYMITIVGASPLMQSVLEEKMNRIAEVLLGSVSPFQLMTGKLLGMVGVSLTIGTFYLVGAFIGIHQAGYGQFFPVHVVWWFVVFVMLAVLMFGSFFIAIGAAVTDMKEAQSLMMPVMIVVAAPLFVWLSVVKEPASTLSTVLSLIPPMTPTLMVLRMGVPPGIPMWQPALGVVLVLITTIISILAAARVFRVGILMQGKAARLSELISWVIRG